MDNRIVFGTLQTDDTRGFLPLLRGPTRSRVSNGKHAAPEDRAHYLILSIAWVLPETAFPHLGEAYAALMTGAARRGITRGDTQTPGTFAIYRCIPVA